jgi:hypothetical protein
MRSRKIGVGTKPIANKDTHPVDPTDTQSISRKLTTIHADDSASPGQPANSKPNTFPGAVRRPNIFRHALKCRICVHPQRQMIEDDFVDWKSAAQIVREFRLANRHSLYRHARALNLFPKRRRNVRAALELIIEHAGDIEVNASAIVAAVQALAKINARGELIEREENLTFRNLFDRMTAEELSAYWKHNSLPTWFKDEIIAAGGQVPKEDIDAHKYTDK